MELPLICDSESSDSDGDFGFRHRQRRPRTFKSRINFILHPIDARARFRLTNVHINQIIARLGPILQHETDRNHALTPDQQIKLALRYLATGSNFSVVGDSHGVHKSTVSRCVHRVVEAVNNVLYPELVDWPQNIGQLNNIANEFHRKGGMPSVFGCIDGSHLEIVSPSEDEYQFVNRYSTHSLNGLFVCGPKMRFYYVLTKWPGSVHDARVFRNSTLKRRLDNGWRPLPMGVLLGDSAYPNSDYLITPIDVPQTQQQANFNRAHRRTRRIVECALGLLKQRFRCLLDTMELKKPEFSAEVVRCCTALHNLLLTDDDAEEFLEDWDRPVDPNLEEEDEEEEGNENGNLNRRDELVRLF